jgi:hypothetical protein
MLDEPSDCPDCGVPPGRPHVADCEAEQCPACGWQRLSCGCGAEVKVEERMPWAGLPPGAAECREYGLWSKLVPDRGWVPCSPDDAGAYEDVQRLVAESEWDREKRRWVRTEPTEEVPPVDAPRAKGQDHDDQSTRSVTQADGQATGRH